MQLQFKDASVIYVFSFHRISLFELFKVYSKIDTN